jgi:hypothetical protein
MLALACAEDDVFSAKTAGEFSAAVRALFKRHHGNRAAFFEALDEQARSAAQPPYCIGKAIPVPYGLLKIIPPQGHPEILERMMRQRRREWDGSSIP